jgi:hypothetical protein
MNLPNSLTSYLSRVVWLLAKYIIAARQGYRVVV